MKTNRIILILLLFMAIKAEAQKKNSISLIIGCYTPSEQLNSNTTKSAAIVNFNQENGIITLTDTLHAGVNASFIAVDKKRRVFYAVNELNGDIPAGKVLSFKYSLPWMGATKLSECNNTGNDPCHVSLSAKNKIVTVSNYSSGNIVSIKTNNSGELDCNSSIGHQHKGRGVTEQQSGPRAHQTVAAPFGNYIYTCDLGTDEIYIYKVSKNPFNTEQKHIVKLDSGAGPRHITFHPNKKFAYVVNEINGNVEVFAVNKKDGNLNHLQTIASAPEETKHLAGSADIHFTYDGKYLYTSNRGPFDEIVCFEVDSKTALLTYKSVYPSGGKGPRNFWISPNNRFLLVANQRTNNIVVYAINAADGSLTPTKQELNLYAPVCIAEL